MNVTDLLPPTAKVMQYTAPIREVAAIYPPGDQVAVKKTDTDVQDWAKDVTKWRYIFSNVQ